jgi:hypothetical protein
MPQLLTGRLTCAQYWSETGTVAGSQPLWTIGREFLDCELMVIFRQAGHLVDSVSVVDRRTRSLSAPKPFSDEYTNQSVALYALKHRTRNPESEL